MSGLQISILEAILAQVHITLTGGMFLTAFAIFLNANELQMGILVAIPAILASVGFFSAYVANLTGMRKSLCVFSSGIGRAFFGCFVICMVLGIRLSLTTFFIIILLFNLLLNFSGNLWLSWMSDLVPKEKRGSYFGIRNTIMSGFGMVIAYAGGIVLDRLSQPASFIIIFSTAVLFSTAAAIVLAQQPEPKFEKKSTSIKSLFLIPLRDKNFLSLIRFVSFWYLFGGLAAPFWVVHMIKNLKMAYSAIAVYSIIAGVTSLIFQVWWGKVIDKVKSKPVLTINFVGITCLPGFWFIARPNLLLPIWFDAFFSGIFWSGVNLSLFNILLSLTEDKELKESYFALFSAITGLCGFVSSLIGGLIAQLLANFQLLLFGQRFVNFHLLFFSTIASRIVSLFFLKSVKERESFPVFYTLHLLGDYTIRRLNDHKDLILNTLRFPK